MRIWLDPKRLAACNLSAVDAIAAIGEQNVQVAAGIIGAEPAPDGTAFQYTVNTQGRLTSAAEFKQIVVKSASGRQRARYGKKNPRFDG